MMGCESCEIAQDKGVGIYYFRWKNANIEIVGCREHVQEITDALRDIQERRDNVTEKTGDGGKTSSGNSEASDGGRTPDPAK